MQVGGDFLGAANSLALSELFRSLKVETMSVGEDKGES
jgi:hypothetical protein